VPLAAAHLLGGLQFMSEVREDATAVAEELAPIGPQGEPVHRESAWTGAAWTPRFRCSHADCLMTVRARWVGVGGAPEPAWWPSPQQRSHRRREGVRRSALHGSH
jgi:hypothetical protein